VDLVFAERGEDHIEFSLFFGRGGSATASGRSSGHGNRSGGGNAPLLFQQLAEFRGLEDREGREVVDEFGEISHCCVFLYRYVLVRTKPRRAGTVWSASGGFALVLVGIGGQHAGDLPAGLLQDRGDTGRRLLEHAGEGRTQLIQRRHRGQRLDVVGVKTGRTHR